MKCNDEFEWIPDSMTTFAYGVKVRSMQEDDELRMWVDSWISWFKP